MTTVIVFHHAGVAVHVVYPNMKSLDEWDVACGNIVRKFHRSTWDEAGGEEPLVLEADTVPLYVNDERAIPVQHADSFLIDLFVHKKDSDITASPNNPFASMLDGSRKKIRVYVTANLERKPEHST